MRLRTSIRSLQVFSVILLFLSVAHARAAQGFFSVDKNVKPGMLVSLTENPGVVAPASNDSVSNLVGVVGDGATDISVQPGQIDVQTDRVTKTLVSTINGDIKVGDRITATSLVGLGGKLIGDGWIVGIAQGSMDANTSEATKTSVSDTTGVKHDVYVGQIPVLIKVTYYNSSDVKQEKNIIIGQFQTLADSVAGRHASQIAIILSFIILCFGLAISGLIVNSAVKNAIKSTGRQPLSKQPVMRQVMQSCAIALGISGIAIISSLILIRLL